jgi:hypothetical protein
MDQNYAWKHGFNLTRLEYPITAWNVDRTKNKQGTIWYYTDLQVNGKMNTEQFLITGLGNQKIILGLPWLQEHNPEINWKEGTLQWRATTMKEVLDKEEHLNRPVNASDKVLLEYLGMENKLWINSKENLSKKLASEANQKKLDLTPEQLVPWEYHNYLDIFDEDKANWFPDTWPWDHKIEMKSKFEPKSFKTYNLTPEEQVELDKFLKENLEKGYIKLSQSPMASPFFFVKKKDGKLRPCQDYRYLSNWLWKTRIHYHLSPKSWTKSKAPNSLPNLMSDGVIITSGSKLRTNGKQHPKQTEDYSNPQLCPLECVTLQQHSKQWWTPFSLTW